MTIVKICGLTNLEDARWACRCGADLLGFIFVPSTPRYISPTAAQTIVATLKKAGCPAHAVGVFADTSAQEINRIAAMVKLDLIQIHGELPADLGALDRPVILAHRVRDRISWDELRTSPAWAHLLDSYHPGRLGGTGNAWRWDLLNAPGDRPERLIVAGGLSPDNVAQAIDRARPWGVDVSTGVELGPGKKDPDKVRQFIRKARGTDYVHHGN